MTDLTKGSGVPDHDDGGPIAAMANPFATPGAGAEAEAAQAPPGYGQPPAPYGYAPPPTIHLGKVRSTGVCILLAIVTLGIYAMYWYYVVHDDMKRHSGTGLGGVVALILALFVGFVSPFFTSSEVGMLYERRGQEKPVSGKTGLWYIPGILILVGPIVWFVKTNGALNAYWRSLGVQG